MVKRYKNKGKGRREESGERVVRGKEEEGVVREKERVVRSKAPVEDSYEDSYEEEEEVIENVENIENVVTEEKESVGLF